MGRRSRALLLLSALSACSPAPEAKPFPTDGGPADAGPFTPDDCKPSLDAGASAAVTVGSGQTSYLDIPDDTDLEWEKGPQGGHHVWIAIRQKDLRRLGTVTVLDMHDIEDPANPRLVNHSSIVYGFDRDEGGWCTLAGIRMQLDNGSIDLASLQEHRLEIVVRVTDPDGATATAKKTIRVHGVVD